jgi:hypothetical protein
VATYRLALGIQVSPRTVRKYMPKQLPGPPRGDQRWSAFLKNHAKGILACDFFVAGTATFRMLYVFVVVEYGARRLADVNVTAQPSAERTLQQLREVAGQGPDAHHRLHHRAFAMSSGILASQPRPQLWHRPVVRRYAR